MPRYDKRQLYIKRVLREINRHSDDKWIDIEIENDLRDRFGDKPDAVAVAEMPSWRLVAANAQQVTSLRVEIGDLFLRDIQRWTLHRTMSFFLNLSFSRLFSQLLTILILL